MREGVRLASRADAWVAAGLLRRADRLPDLVDQIIVRPKPAIVWFADCAVGHGLLNPDRGTVPHERTQQKGPSSSMRPTSTQTAWPTVPSPSSASDDQRSLQGDDGLPRVPPGAKRPARRCDPNRRTGVVSPSQASLLLRGSSDSAAAPGGGCASRPHPRLLDLDRCRSQPKTGERFCSGQFASSDLASTRAGVCSSSAHCATETAAGPRLVGRPKQGCGPSRPCLAISERPS